MWSPTTNPIDIFIPIPITFPVDPKCLSFNDIRVWNDKIVITYINISFITTNHFNGLSVLQAVIKFGLFMFSARFRTAITPRFDSRDLKNGPVRFVRKLAQFEKLINQLHSQTRFKKKTDQSALFTNSRNFTNGPTRYVRKLTRFYKRAKQLHWQTDAILKTCQSAYNPRIFASGAKKLTRCFRQSR